MKKLLSILAISLSLILIAGCSQTPSMSLSGSYFLENRDNKGVANIDETVNYAITFTEAELDKREGITISLKSGSYSTHLTKSKYNDIDCYLLTTVLKTSLTYLIDTITANGEIETVETEVYNDEIITKAYFLGVNNDLRALYSERVVKAHSPLYQNDVYTVNSYAYTLKTTYEDDNCTVNFEKTEGEFSLTDGNKVYKDYDKDVNYFDNEVMLFMPRAINLTENTSFAFNSIDALSGVNRSMQLYSDTTTKTQLLEFDPSKAASETVYTHDYFRNGYKLPRAFYCRVVNFSATGTFSGSPIKCWYATVDEKAERSRLIKMQVTMPYSMGTFNYVVTDATVVE